MPGPALPEVSEIEPTHRSGVRLTCAECGYLDYYLPDHLLEQHGLSVTAYQKRHPGSPTVSQEVLDEFNRRNSNVKREHPPELSALQIEIGNLTFSVNWDVPPEACLPFPEHYRVPKTGRLSWDVFHALVALRNRRNTYIWGLPGSGKDALVHAYSAWTRSPAKIFEVQPGVDLQSWFFTRGFNERGTVWEEGEFLTAARDGYCPQAGGRRIPYLILISDFDRADKTQQEAIRLVSDTIKGRVPGPRGSTYEVLPGTLIVATGNTCGSGDTRGRCITSNPLDASILARFSRKFEFHYMEWADEELIVKNKFPFLAQRMPDVFAQVGKATASLRDAVEKSDLFSEFSHREVCSWLEHTEDILRFYGGVTPSNLLALGAKAWLDGSPDEATRQAAEKLTDAAITNGLLHAGSTAHISNEPLMDFLARRKKK